MGLLTLCFAAGPPVGADELELPDRAGVKISWWTYLKFFWILITRLPTVLRNKPSKAAARATQVSVQALRATIVT